MEKQVYTVKPVGQVRTGSEGFMIEIDEVFRPGLSGLRGFSHLVAVWWATLTDTKECRSLTTFDKPYTKGPEKIGVFATRSPARPNPIGISTVALIDVDMHSGIIRIPWIDAEDGTPVLDLKPYHPSEDRVRDVSVPGWCSHWPLWLEKSGDFKWDEEFVFED